MTHPSHPTQLDAEREEFEKWMQREHPRHSLLRTDYSGDHGDGDYLEMRTSEKWYTWQARAALSRKAPAKLVDLLHKIVGEGERQMNDDRGQRFIEISKRDIRAGRKLLDAIEARAALAASEAAPAVAPSAALPNPGSPEASAMIDSLLAEYQWPGYSKNAARAGYEAARRMLVARSPAVATVPTGYVRNLAVHALMYLQERQYGFVKQALESLADATDAARASSPAGQAQPSTPAAPALMNLDGMADRMCFKYEHHHDPAQRLYCFRPNNLSNFADAVIRAARSSAPEGAAEGLTTGVPDHIARDVEQAESADRWCDGVPFKSRWERKLYESGFSAGWDRARAFAIEQSLRSPSSSTGERNG